MKSALICLMVLIAITLVESHTHIATETEMFAIPISPNMFNWTYQEFDQQYRFHASLQGKPALPFWLRYIYSGRHHSGFIFGTPPRDTTPLINVEVIGLNRQDYETRRLLLTIKVQPKQMMALHEVELKIDNLNVEDLLDEHRMVKLKDIFRSKLWLESSEDLYATFLSSAIDLGARLPLKPNDGEGLVVRLGSFKPFSEELKRLREEVRPLSRIGNCPREYKRTTVERLFRDAGLTLDWCNFQLYNTIHNDRSTELVEYLSEIPNASKGSNSRHKTGKQPLLNDGTIWTAPSRSDLPSRSYMKEFTVAVVVPILLMVVSITALTAVLCVHYAGIAHKSSKVELCRYGVSNSEQTTNEPNPKIGDSSTNDLARPYSPKSTTNLAANYNRPQPPPYVGSNTNSLHHRKSNIDKTSPSTSGHTPEHNRGHLALEESLKLLNEANISSVDYIDNINADVKDPILDMNDGVDDYVPIKTDNGGYLKNLDEINVPELSNFGVGGAI